jgi:hypothetical protein
MPCAWNWLIRRDVGGGCSKGRASSTSTALTARVAPTREPATIVMGRTLSQSVPFSLVYTELTQPRPCSGLFLFGISMAGARVNENDAIGTDAGYLHRDAEGK